MERISRSDQCMTAKTRNRKQVVVGIVFGSDFIIYLRARVSWPARSGAGRAAPGSAGTSGVRHVPGPAVHPPSTCPPSDTSETCRQETGQGVRGSSCPPSDTSETCRQETSQGVRGSTRPPSDTSETCRQERLITCGLQTPPSGERCGARERLTRKVIQTG